MGHVNVIWQGDSNAQTLQAFGLTASPPFVLNVAGSDIASVRELATKLAEIMGEPLPRFVGTEAETALLNNADRARDLFGREAVSLGQLVAWTGSWLRGGGRLLGKPTGFEARDGRF